jgi:NAD(P)-dependent dehydrogenase (short-subunit alcohol dehydrogenase family)
MRVLVTGGGTGLGLGIAQALLAAGDAVVICGRRAEPLAAAVAALKAEAASADVQWFQADVRDDPQRLLDAAGAVDGLVHNAGIYRHGAVGAWAAEDWAELFAVHVQGPALLSQAFAARCAGPGALVFVGSTLAERSAPGAGAYAAAKAAQRSLCATLALELAPRGIRANAVLAGVVPTAMTTAPPRRVGGGRRSWSACARCTPWGGWARPPTSARRWRFCCTPPGSPARPSRWTADCWWPEARRWAKAGRARGPGRFKG